MIRQKVTITNETGLHLRPASILAKAAEACSSKVEIHYKNSIINARSLLNIVAAAIAKGTEIEIYCTGENEEADMAIILDALSHLE